jgi:hypothetical protein
MLYRLVTLYDTSKYLAMNDLWTEFAETGGYVKTCPRRGDGLWTCFALHVHAEWLYVDTFCMKA